MLLRVLLEEKEIVVTSSFLFCNNNINIQPHFGCCVYSTPVFYKGWFSCSTKNMSQEQDLEELQDLEEPAKTLFKAPTWERAMNDDFTIALSEFGLELPRDYIPEGFDTDVSYVSQPSQNSWAL